MLQRWMNDLRLDQQECDLMEAAAEQAEGPAAFGFSCQEPVCQISGSTLLSLFHSWRLDFAWTSI